MEGLGLSPKYNLSNYGRVMSCKYRGKCAGFRLLRTVVLNTAEAEA